MKTFCRHGGMRFTTVRAVLLSLVIFLISGPAVHAGDYKVRKRAGPYTVDMAINRNPPVLGVNEISITLRDTEGRCLSGARVAVNYSMPPMPGMVPMNYTVPAAPYGNGYRARMNFIMTGPWNIAVRLQAGGAHVKVVFPIDVR